MSGKSGGRRKGDASELERLRRDWEELRTSLESMQTYYEDLLGSLQDAIIVVDPGGRSGSTRPKRPSAAWRKTCSTASTTSRSRERSGR